MRVLSSLVLVLVVCAPLAAQETEKTTIGGYGEVHYNNSAGPNSPGIINVARFVVFLSHQFNEKIAFRSEVEVEDTKVQAGHDNAGEVSVEQVYLDYQLSSAATIRTGLVLAPIGIINETHEPTTFNGVDRPAFDHDVIPTTWRDIGVGLVGTPGSSGFSYRVYLLNGLTASQFTAAEGIREGRQEGQLARFTNPSLTGRLEWARPGLRIGGSFWYGGSANQDPALGTGTFDNAVTLVSADARYDTGPFMFRGVVANITIADAEAINAAFSSQIGSRIAGGYLEGAYDVLSTLAPRSSQQLNAFIRHERYNTQAGVPSGVTRDDALARRVTTFGLTYKPLYNVAFKGDYQLLRNRAGLGENEVFSLGLGYQF